jgi:DNA-binding PadR family transcriptional regulator
MASLTKTSYVILGMLALGMRTGYDIKALVDVSTRCFWAASYGQIYPELQRLEQAGLVRGEPDPQDGRRRKLYELTPAGERALREWIAADAPLHLELRHEGLLKFFFADAVGPEERVELLRRMRTVHEAEADRLRRIAESARAKQAERGKRMPALTAEFGVAYNDFIVEWCSRMEQELQAEAHEVAGR